MKIEETPGYKGQIKSSPVEGDNQIISLDGILESLEVLTIHKLMNLCAIVETDHGNFVVVTAHAGSFDVKETATVFEVPVKAPALRRGEAVVEVSSLANILH